LNVWDVGGQSTLRPYWRNYFEETDGLIWVVDSADTQRLNDTRDELHKLLHEEKLAGAPLLIFANKTDLPAARPLEQIVQVAFASLQLACCAVRCALCAVCCVD
jgi:ADP-ribosylation factor-like protein 2